MTAVHAAVRVLAPPQVAVALVQTERHVLTLLRPLVMHRRPRPSSAYVAP